MIETVVSIFAIIMVGTLMVGGILAIGAFWYALFKVFHGRITKGYWP